MKSLAEVERLVKEFRIKPTVKMREKTLNDALKAQEGIKKRDSVVTQLNIWRIITNPKLKKLTVVSIALVCLLPLCYGVHKFVTHTFVVDEGVMTYPNEEDNGGNKQGYYKVGVMTTQPLNDEEIAKAKEDLKQINKELNELRQAGKFERTFVKEDERQDGVKIRFYKDHFILSSGKTIIMNTEELWKDGKLIRAGGGSGGGTQRNESEKKPEQKK